MIKILSFALVLTLSLAGLAYFGLLSNWFRYEPSLEAIFVSVPLILGVSVSSVLAVLAYRRNSRHLLAGAFVAAGLAAILVVEAQFHAFGEMPSLYANDVRRSPTGRIVTPQGDVEYWIELRNPFANGHREYVVIRRGVHENRLLVPIFDGPAGAILYGDGVAGWGRLEATSATDVYLLKIGSSLPRGAGKIFKINLHTGVVEVIQATNH